MPLKAPEKTGLQPLLYAFVLSLRLLDSESAISLDVELKEAKSRTSGAEARCICQFYDTAEAVSLSKACFRSFVRHCLKPNLYVLIQGPKGPCLIQRQSRSKGKN
jgi:hypothetical protein